MSLRTLATLAVGIGLLTACSSTQPTSLTSTGNVPQFKFPAGICYGTNGLEATPCPVKLNKKDKGSVTVSVGGPGVVIVVPIASDCIGPGSDCNLSRDGSSPTQFVISSVRGQNLCGTAWVVFEGLTANQNPVGTATVEVINRYC